MATSPVPPDRRRVNSRTWSTDKVDRLCALIAQGHRQNAIAATMGVSTGMIAGQVSRLRTLGDPRIPAAGASPATPGKGAARAAAGTRAADRLAEAMAAGCPNLRGAAIRLSLPLDQVERIWADICRGLGRQAA